MEFEDQTTIRLCNDFVGSGSLVESGLSSIIATAYDLSGQVPSGPFSYAYDELITGGFGYRETETRGPEGDVRREISIQSEAGNSERIDLLWRGKIRASAAYPLARVDVEAMAAIGLSGLDAEIPGTLPTDPAILESARRAALLARLKSAANDPDAIDLSVVDLMLLQSEAGSISEMMTLDGGSARYFELVLSLTEIPGSTAARARDFPVACAILVRDVGKPENSLSAMLQASRAILASLDQAGFSPRESAELPPGRACVVWVVPASWFDLSDWPGTGGTAAAKRANRISLAGTWLSRQGIALNPIS